MILCNLFNLNFFPAFMDTDEAEVKLNEGVHAHSSRKKKGETLLLGCSLSLPQAPSAIKPAGVDFPRHREPLKIVLETSSLRATRNNFVLFYILDQSRFTFKSKQENHRSTNKSQRVHRKSPTIFTNLDTPIFGEFLNSLKKKT
ncbi:Uncharacterized protein APZ42_019111, partial [Daphnia magna]